MKAVVKFATLAAMMVALSVSASSAQGAAGDPLFVFVPQPTPPPAPPVPPPTGHFDGPCGIAVNSGGTFYVSDYYHNNIDFFRPTEKNPHLYLGSIGAGDSLDGPCGLAFNSIDSLYVNTFHRNVAGEATFDPDHPTGVAIDTSSDRLYADHRTYIAVYESTGAPVLDAGLPLKIGLGNLEDGYGLAVSRFPATAGRLYVPDAATDTVKVYDPAAANKVSPVATIAPPDGHFNSLRDSAVAVDRVTGKVYVADNLQPRYIEEPEAVIEVFDASGAYLGRLKYKIVDALPPGLAVDNSAASTQGRVYVTSGNTDEAGIYGYSPGSEVSSSLPAIIPASVTTAGSGSGSITSSLGDLDCRGSCEVPIRAGAEVSLNAAPDPGSIFIGWIGGGCSESGGCTVTMDEATSVTAVFEAFPGPAALGSSGSLLAPPGAGSADLPVPAAAPRRAHRHQRTKHRHHRSGRRGGSQKHRGGALDG
jgi:DNA-binding beta-propeller fold protein YncE